METRIIPALRAHTPRGSKARRRAEAAAGSGRENASGLTPASWIPWPLLARRVSRGPLAGRRAIIKAMAWNQEGMPAAQAPTVEERDGKALGEAAAIMARLRGPGG